MSTSSATRQAGALWRITTDDTPVALASAPGLLAIAGAEGAAGIHDADSGEQIARVQLDGGLIGAAFSPDGAHLVLFGPGGYRLWHREGGAGSPIATGWSARAAWAGADRVAVAAGRGAVVLSASGEPLWRTAQAPSTVTDLAWIRKGRELAICAYNGIYRYAKHQVAPVAELAYPGSHLSMAVSADDKWICTGNQDASVHIWRMRDGKELEMGGYPSKVSRTAFDPTGRWLANDGSPDVTVWDFSGSGPGGSYPRILPAHTTITGIAWRPGNDVILASCGAEGTVALWQVRDAKAGKEAEPLVTYALGSEPTALVWLHPSRLVVAHRCGMITSINVADALRTVGAR
ncbi:MAG: WD40 repeat domain-containing protein [Sporichthyaceae bacterium]